MGTLNYLKMDYHTRHVHVHACEITPHSNVFRVTVKEKFVENIRTLVLPSTSPFKHFDGKTYILTPLEGENSMIELSRFNLYYGGREL